MTKIKICGLKRMEDVDYVNESMPDYVGFVFAGTKRKIDMVQAQKLKAKLNPQIPAVGVFVDEPMENIVQMVGEHIIDLVQLHGSEDETYIKSLKEQISVPIIKAVKVKSTEDILKAQGLDVDYLLLDAYSKNEAGGTGQQFDRNLIPDSVKNYFLAGGIGADNLESVIRECNPYAVDMSSSLETDGFKDREKIREVMKIIRNINKQQI